MRRLASLALTAAMAAAPASLLARETASAHVAAPGPHITGDRSICHGLCLTNANEVWEDGHSLQFEPGVQAYGGYWTIARTGTVGDKWPFVFKWADRRWNGNGVYQIYSFTFNHRFAAWICDDLVYACLRTRTSYTDWVAVPYHRQWVLVSVGGTDLAYAQTRLPVTYVLQSPGRAGARAQILPRGGTTLQDFDLEETLH
jgi:uncharacterized membrane protein